MDGYSVSNEIIETTREIIQRACANASDRDSLRKYWNDDPDAELETRTKAEKAKKRHRR